MLALCLLTVPVRAQDARELQDYQAALQQAGDDPSKLRLVTPVVGADRKAVELEVGWTRWRSSREARETLRALESRVDAARWTRPTAFDPFVVRQRLSNLLDRLYPTRIRSLGAPVDDPVAVRPTHWSYGSVAYVGGGGGGYGHGHSHVRDVVVSNGGGSGGHVRHGHGSGGTATTRTRSGPRTYGSRVTTQTRTAHAPPQPQYQQAHTYQPPRVQQHVQPHVPQPVARVNHSRPTEITHAPPKAPAVQPPPPPKPLVENKKETTPWWKVLLMVLAAASPLVAWIIWRSRQKGAKKPVARPPKSVADLIDPEHRGLDAAGMARVGRESAMDEDWMKAMRYLFAAVLTHLTQRRGAAIEDWHTNKEIASLVVRDRKLAESFWSAATIFELFWFGERRPMENDYRLFETLAHECMGVQQ